MPSPRLIAASAVFALAAFAVVVPAASASANTAPNTFTPTGSAWVDVPASQRVYLENFGEDDYDDDAIYEVPAGITCTYNSVTATGPFLTAEELTDSDCVDASSAPYNPIDTAAKKGAIPFGFGINFYGTKYTSAYPNTNGGIYFDQPDTDYDETLAYLADEAQSSVMFPLAADLDYISSTSNFWTAQTTVDGAPAVVFSWEKFASCCGDDTNDISFQLVIIDRNSANGDFDAWFNYESVVGLDEGYDSPAVQVDLGTGVTVGSNVLVSNDVSNVSADCTEGASDVFGTPTDTTFTDDLNNTFYFKLENAAAHTVSVWSDGTCTTPINVTAVQDEATSKKAYVQLTNDEETQQTAVGVGWSTYDPATAAIDSTELLRNVDITELANGAPNPLINRSLNTTVPGRFIIGQRGGKTVTDAATLTPAAAAAATLAETGTDDTSLVGFAGLLVLAGIALVGVRLRRRAIA